MTIIQKINSNSDRKGVGVGGGGVESSKGADMVEGG